MIYYIFLVLRALVKTVQAVYGATVGFTMAAIDILVNLFRHIIMSTPSLVFLTINGVVYLLFLVLVYNPEFFMRTGDLVWECGLHPVADAAITYGLRPVRDFVFNPVAGYANRMSDFARGEFGNMIDAIEELPGSPGSGLDHFMTTMDEIYNFVALDFMETPMRVAPPLFGPDFLELPFERWLIHSLWSANIDAQPGFNRHTVGSLKNILQSLMRWDIFTKSCFYSTLRSTNRIDWAFRGCNMFDDPEYLVDHITPTNCHNNFEELVRWALPAGQVYIAYTLTNFTKTLELFVDTLSSGDICGAILTGTPRVEPEGCYLDSYNCSYLDWWILSFRPGDCREFPRAEDRTVRIKQLDPTCELWDVCDARPKPDRCAIVNKKWAFSNMDCADFIAAAAGGSINIKSCRTISKSNETDECHRKTWAYWIHVIINELANIYKSMFEAYGDVGACAAHWIQKVFAFLPLLFDRGCQATWVEKIQYFLWHILVSWIECILKPLTSVIFQWKFTPIHNGLWMGWDLFGEIFNAGLDGTLLTQSRFFCGDKMPAIGGCERMVRSYEDNGCFDVDPDDAYAGSPAGIAMLELECRNVGYGQTCATLCDPPLGNTTGCPWFNDKYCYDVAILGIDRIFVPYATCADLYDTCALRYAFHNSTECGAYAGCRIVSGPNSCPDDVAMQHIFTDRFWWIVNSTLSNFTANLLYMEIGDWTTGIEYDQIQKMTAFYELLTDVGKCITNTFKGLFGSMILFMDPTCDGTVNEAMTYLIRYALEDAVQCYLAFSDAMYKIGWKLPAQIWEDAVMIISQWVPHVWTLNYFKADTHNCNFRVQLYLLEGGKIFYEWPGDQLDGWAYEGCHIFSGGICEAYWEDCDGQIGEPGCEECTDCTDPYGETYQWVGTTIRRLLQPLIDAWNLDTIPIVSDILFGALDIIDVILHAVQSLTCDYLKDVIGWMIVLFDKGCRMDGKAKGMFFLYKLLRIPVVIITAFVDTFRIIGSIMGSIWSMIMDLIMFILEETGIFDFIFDVVNEVKIISYCFGPVHDPLSPDDPGYFYYPPDPVTLAYPDYYQNYYNFTNCASTWPGQYYYKYGVGSKCDLPGCFRRTWECIRYENVSGLGVAGIERSGSIFLNIMKSRFIERAVTGMLEVVNYIACAITCMKVCDSCYNWKVPNIGPHLKCYGKCLIPGSTWCLEADNPFTIPGMDNLFFEKVIDYGCLDVCSCDNGKTTYGCYLLCVIWHGSIPLELDECSMTDVQTATLCHDMMDPADYIAPLTYTNSLPAPYGNPSLGNPSVTRSSCRDLSPILAPAELLMQSIGGGTGLVNLVAKYWQAVDWCKTACPNDPLMFYAQNVDMQESCAVFRTLVYDLVGTPLSRLVSIRDNIPLAPASDPNKTLEYRAYCQWTLTSPNDDYTWPYHTAPPNPAFVKFLLYTPYCGSLDCRSYHFVKRLLAFVFDYANSPTMVTRTYETCQVPGILLTAGTALWRLTLEDPAQCSKVMNGTGPFSIASGDVANVDNVPTQFLDGYPAHMHTIIVRGGQTNITEDDMERGMVNWVEQKIRATIPQWELPPNMPWRSPDCYCSAVLHNYDAVADQLYRYTTLELRIKHAYCSVVHQLYIKDQNNRELRNAYCDMNLKNGNILTALREIKIVSMAMATKSQIRNRVSHFLVAEIANGIQSGFIDLDGIEHMKASVRGAVDGIYELYSGSVLEDMIEDGYRIHRDPYHTKKDQSAWGLRCLDKLYEWSLDQSPPPGVRRAPGSRNTVPGLQQILREMGGRTRVERRNGVVPEPRWKVWWDKVGQFRAWATENDVPLLREAPPPPPPGQKKDPDEDMEESIGFFEHWLPGPPHLLDLPENREPHTYLFFPKSEKLAGNLGKYIQRMAEVTQENYHATGARMDAIVETPVVKGLWERSDSPFDFVINLTLDAFAFILERIRGWFDGKFEGGKELWSDVFDLVLEVLMCQAPAQYNGDTIYNIFCIAIPEGLFSWIPDKGQVITAVQIPWADELIEVPCVIEEYPVGERPYWRMPLNNCRNHTHPFEPEKHPACPFCDYCKREYNPLAVRMDVLDCLILTVRYVCNFIDYLIDPRFPSGYHPTFGDTIHFALNIVILFVAVAAVVAYEVGPQPAKIAGMAVSGLYMFVCGFPVHMLIAMLINFIYGGTMMLIFIIAFIILLAAGGIPFPYNPVAWVAEWLGWIETGLHYALIPTDSWLRPLAERFERYAGAGPVPAAYAQLYIFYISKTAFGLAMAYILTVAILLPGIKLLGTAIDSIMEVAQILTLVWQGVRLHTLRGTVTDHTVRLDELQLNTQQAETNISHLHNWVVDLTDKQNDLNYRITTLQRKMKSPL